MKDTTWEEGKPPEGMTFRFALDCKTGAGVGWKEEETRARGHLFPACGQYVNLAKHFILPGLSFFFHILGMRCFPLSILAR
jgi:hypothetical protein